MLKNILSLNGAQPLSRDEQQTVNGGMLEIQRCCNPAIHCCRPNPSSQGCRFLYSTPPVCI